VKLPEQEEYPEVFLTLTAVLQVTALVGVRVGIALTLDLVQLREQAVAVAVLEVEVATQRLR
jgi:hypothetical protein